MIRNLVLKLPSLKYSSEYAFSSLYRKRDFRSLSPVQRLRSDASTVNSRSVSCTRSENGHSLVNLDATQNPLLNIGHRKLCFSKEYYANSRPIEPEPSKEVQWRETQESPQKTVQQPDGVVYTKPDTVHFETLEQYELEAARPRPTKSKDLIEAFALKSNKIDKFGHLQPNQMKPYGSADNLYSTILLRPTNSLKYPKKFKRPKSKEYDSSGGTDLRTSRGERRYSTSARRAPDVARKLSTTKTIVAKEGHSTKDEHFSDKISSRYNNHLNFPSMPRLPTYSQFPKSANEHWDSPRLNISPPKYIEIDHSVDEFQYIKCATPAMRQQRKEEENRKGSVNYKSSYSDLVKLRLKERENAKLDLTTNIIDSAKTDNICVSCFTKKSDRPGKMLDAFKNQPGKRSLTTRSKSNMLNDSQTNEASSKKLSGNNLKDQKPFSKLCSSKYNKRSAKSKNAKIKQDFNPECENVCTPVFNALEKSKARRFPYEPTQCEEEPAAPKVYLASKVKLAVPPCTPRPAYIDCKPPVSCDAQRADECLEIKPKKLPKLISNECPCIDPAKPSISPKLQRLHFSFEDTPRVSCVEPVCQTPRADDHHPYKHKPLKPYVPGDCACVQPPPLLDVKVKRLPKCAPEEICRPPRICIVPEPCAGRADECHRVVPKKLPILKPPSCPCVEPPPPTVAPNIKRLDLRVPEPERLCPTLISCPEVERADDHLTMKKKKLPKFVPGDCPCVDKPMHDWNLKRLVCEDEPVECPTTIPSPCSAFPRADWGCWEYNQDLCEELDEKCVERHENCVTPVKKPCRKKSVCEAREERRNMTKRKFSHSSSSSSLRLFQQIKSKIPTDQGPAIIPLAKHAPQTNQKIIKNDQLAKKTQPELKVNPKRQVSVHSLNLIKMLHDLQKSHKSTDDHLLFKPTQNDKLDYQKVLRTIAETTAQLEKKEAIKAASMTPQSIKKPKSNNTITVSSRAISTTEHLSKTESEIRKEKNCRAKLKCKKIKPSLKSLMCQRKPCPRHVVCDKELTQERVSGCRFERAPVCCDKEDAPYSSFSESMEETIRPYTNTPQWTCNRPQYGFHPVTKKEFDPLDPKKKEEKKKFSTYTLLSGLPLPDNIVLKGSDRRNLSKQTLGAATMRTYRPRSFNISPKGFLKKSSTPNLTDIHSRSFATKIFHHPPCKLVKPSTECGAKSRETGRSPKITCQIDDECVSEQRWCCKKNYANPTTRKPPPFPAFSDCLDEEMEDILTECPLDRDKYLVMQPKYMMPPKKPLILKPPPPYQGKIDVFKEQQCIREKLCLEKGVTQSCTDFGKPIPLLKTKKMIKEERHDCERIEELKKLGRWPPYYLKSNRKFSTASALSRREFRSFSTIGLNSFNDVVNEKNGGAKRIYIRNYHALRKGGDKALLMENEDNFKEITKKLFPNIDETTKLLKLKNNHWRIQNLNIYEQLNRHSNIARRVKRYYTTYKTRRRNGLRRGMHQRLGYSSSRKFSSVLRNKTQYFRGQRYFKSGRNKEKVSSKFTLAKTHKKKSYKDLVARDSAPKSKTLQPRFSVFSDQNNIVKDFPNEDKIDRALGIDYYKCKHDIVNEGQTIDCDCLKKLFSSKGKQSKSKTDVEFLVRDHKESNSKELEETACCSQAPKCNYNPTDEKSLNDICFAECLKTIPCHLPEEEKHCICKDRCKQVVDQMKCEAKETKSKQTPNEEMCEPCEPEKKKCTKPKAPRISCKTKAKLICHSAPKPKCIKSRPVCKDVALKPSCSRVKWSKSITQLETIWQKVVNYFKARPNCPEPGEYKKQALKQRAEKAANAAGLVVVDPKCLPADVLKNCHSPTSDCKVCPKQDTTSESKTTGTRSCSPSPNKRTFSTNVQPSRNYSGSCNNLADINRILEEGEIKRRFKKTNNSLNKKKDLGVFPDRKDADTAKALKMSLDVNLNKRVDLSELCRKNKKIPKTYFGYSDIIPSRENILERAWRISIEAYNKYNYPKTYNFFNEFFTRVEKSVKTVEDLEKLKTENVLRELDEFLKSEDPSSTKKKK